MLKIVGLLYGVGWVEILNFIRVAVALGSVSIKDTFYLCVELVPWCIGMLRCILIVSPPNFCTFSAVTRLLNLFCCRNLTMCLNKPNFGCCVLSKMGMITNLMMSIEDNFHYVKL